MSFGRRGNTYAGMRRRRFLRGLGVTMTLPWLPSLWPSRASIRSAYATAEGADVPRRLVFFYVPNGMPMHWWTPNRAGANYDLPAILEPLAPIQDQVNVLTGLANGAAEAGFPGDHARGTGSFLTCRNVSHSTTELDNGVSVDQLAVQRTQPHTRFPSLELGMEGGINVGNCDSGYACAYQRNISWAAAATPRPKMTDPRLVFNRLFAGADAGESAQELARRRMLRLSVLDAVQGEAQRLRPALSGSDRTKLDEYLTGVRELEIRIDSAGGSTCVPPAEPSAGQDIAAQARAMNELMVLALRCDMTRIITFMLGNGGSNRSYDFLGIPYSHHQLSHHQSDGETLDKLRSISRWEVAQFADLLTRMATVMYDDGTSLLDHSLLVFSSEIEDGDTHAHRNLPVLLAGGGGGTVISGRHILYPDDEPLANLYIAMLASVGVQVDRFGEDGTRPIRYLS